MHQPPPGFEFRKAKISEVKAIQRLINDAAGREQMLARSLSDIYENLRDFYICHSGGRVLGCCALHVVWENMAEIRSLAVDDGHRNAGVGASLVRLCLDESRQLGIGTVFALTYIPRYFEKLGFHEVSKETLPHKIWSECVKCPKFPDCSETALMYP
jgi:amino-acid N-acetyltransferase